MANQNRILIIIIIVVVVLAAVAGTWIYLSKQKLPLPDLNQNISRDNKNVNIPVVLAGDGYLYLSSEKSSYQVGDDLAVDILMDTQGLNINVAQAKVNFDAQILELVEIDTDSSVFNLAVGKEVTQGSAFAARGKPGDSDPHDEDDGFTGSAGLLATLKFKALAAGLTHLTFEAIDSVMVLDNGLGTKMNMEYGGLEIEILTD